VILTGRLLLEADPSVARLGRSWSLVKSCQLARNDANQSGLGGACNAHKSWGAVLGEGGGLHRCRQELLRPTRINTPGFPPRPGDAGSGC